MSRERHTFWGRPTGGPRAAHGAAHAPRPVGRCFAEGFERSQGREGNTFVNEEISYRVTIKVDLTSVIRLGPDHTVCTVIRVEQTSVFIDLAALTLFATSAKPLDRERSF